MTGHEFIWLSVCFSGVIALVAVQCGLYSGCWWGCHLAFCGVLLGVAIVTIWGLSHQSLYWPCGCATMAMMFIGSILDFGGPRRESII